MKAHPIGLLLLAVTGGTVSGATWEDLSSEAAEAGLATTHVEAIVERCRARGWQPDAARSALRFAMRAAEEGVPGDPILIRVEEGVTKGIEPERVAQAAEQRYTSLARADHLLHETLGPSVPGHGGIVLSLSRALECGLSEEGLADLLRAGRETRPGPMMAVLDAGELLRHAGFSEADSMRIMEDCLDRDTGRRQIMRISQLACEQIRQGADVAQIRETLRSTPLPSGGGRARGQGPNR